MLALRRHAEHAPRFLSFAGSQGPQDWSTFQILKVEHFSLPVDTARYLRPRCASQPVAGGDTCGMALGLPLSTSASASMWEPKPEGRTTLKDRAEAMLGSRPSGPITSRSFPLRRRFRRPTASGRPARRSASGSSGDSDSDFERRAQQLGIIGADDGGAVAAVRSMLADLDDGRISMTSHQELERVARAGTTDVDAGAEQPRAGRAAPARCAGGRRRSG